MMIAAKRWTVPDVVGIGQRLFGVGGRARRGEETAGWFHRWRILGRRRLDTGGAGGPMYQVGLEPVDLPVGWQAGDIAELAPGVTWSSVPSDASPTCPYPIASLPVDGRLELLVPQLTGADGALDAGSDWLTVQVPVGAKVWLRIRPNDGPRTPGLPSA